MGSASSSATDFSSTAQLSLVGSASYNTLKSGLNKTDASFASLVNRCVGEAGPP